MTGKEFKKIAINKMMEIYGYSYKYEDLLKLSSKDPKWFDTLTTTAEKEKEFEAWFIANAQKKLRMSKRYAQQTFGWFILTYGLKVNE